MQKFLIFLALNLISIKLYPVDISSVHEPIDRATYINLLSLENDLDHAKPIVKTLMQIAKDPKIKGLIIHMNCYGSPVGTSKAIFSELKKFKKIKPVIVVVENGCCSGGYHVACPADFIFALPTSDVGSIGVELTFSKHKNLHFDNNNKSGDVEVYVLRTGKYKDLCNPHIPLENWHIEYFKQINQKLYEQFVADVAQERKLSIADEKKWADGQEFIGTEALELGLIDALGDFSDALVKMKELLEARGIKVEGELEIVDIKCD